MSSRSSSLIEGLPRQSLTDRAAPMRLATASARRPCRTEKAEPAPAARASFLTGRLDEHRPYRLLGGGAAQHLGGRRRDNCDLVLGEPRARRRRRFSGRYRQPFADEIRSSSLRLGPPLVSSDELIGNVVQVIAYYLRLRADPKNIVADTPDQRSPAAEELIRAVLVEATGPKGGARGRCRLRFFSATRSACTCAGQSHGRCAIREGLPGEAFDERRRARRHSAQSLRRTR